MTELINWRTVYFFITVISICSNEIALSIFPAEDIRSSFRQNVYEIGNYD